MRRCVLKPRRFGQVHPKTISATLIPTGHLRTGVTKLLLNVTFVYIGG